MVAARQFAKYLPYPTVEKDSKTGRFYLDYDRPASIGKVKGFLALPVWFCVPTPGR